MNGQQAADGRPFVMTVRVSEMAHPGVPSSQDNCCVCGELCWLSFSVSQAFAPVVPHLICQPCVTEVSKRSGVEPQIEIPEGVRDEFARFVENGGRWDGAN